MTNANTLTVDNSQTPQMPDIFIPKKSNLTNVNKTLTIDNSDMSNKKILTTNSNNLSNKELLANGKVQILSDTNLNNISSPTFADSVVVPDSAELYQSIEDREDEIDRDVYNPLYCSISNSALPSNGLNLKVIISKVLEFFARVSQ